MTNIVHTYFGDIDTDTATVAEKDALLAKINQRIAELQILQQREYLYEITQVKRRAKAQGLFDSHDPNCHGFCCITLPLLMADEPNNAKYNMVSNEMPVVPLQRVASLVQEMTGKTFEKPLKVRFIKDAAYDPNNGEIIIDLVTNNDRKELHETEIHEMLEKLSSEKGLGWTHDDIFPLQDRIYAELQKRYFPPASRSVQEILGLGAANAAPRQYS